MVLLLLLVDSMVQCSNTPSSVCYANQNYHGFEQANTAKRPITENAAQSSSLESPKKRAKQASNSLIDSSLSELRKHMKRSLPTRPNNIRMNEV